MLNLSLPNFLNYNRKHIFKQGNVAHIFFYTLPKTPQNSASPQNCQTHYSLQANCSYNFYQLKSQIIQSKPKMKAQSNALQPTAICKKIQNYIFRFSDLLGQGNFSKVYSGTNELTNEIVAIKIVELQSLKSKKLEELLFSEIDVLKKLNHPNVLKCYDVFTSNRNCYIITELCNEGDLQSKLRKQKYFPEQKAQGYIKDIFEGLVYLNQNHVIHRDIKVANIFIHHGLAKIADFGFAKFTMEKFKDISIGSPLYMSPQGFVNNIYGPKTDVWAVGVLIYELLHGTTPYSNCKTQNELRQSLSIPISRHQIRGDISQELKEVILRCMEVDQAKRISIPELKRLPFFYKHLGNQLFPPQIHKNYLLGPNNQKIRSPSYNGEVPHREVKAYNNLQRNEGPRQMVPSIVPQPVKMREIEFQKPTIPSFIQPLTSKNIRLQIPTDDRVITKERRATSIQKFLITQQPQPIMQEPRFIQTTKIPNQTMRILLGFISFKECVNILHYCRLIFKFLLTVKMSEYINNNELFKLTKWLMLILAQIRDKIQRKEIKYEGENALLRQKKLREVRNEYQKKYSSQLQTFISNQQHFRQPAITLDYMDHFCYNIYQKYDSIIDRESNRTLLTLGHCILLICEATKFLKQCYTSQNYSIFMTYKDLEGFLGIRKEKIDIDSYLSIRKKLMMY